MGVHDTDQYERIKELLGIPENEPIFILRAQDKLSVPTVARYLGFARQIEESALQPSEEWFKSLVSVIDFFTAWQLENAELVKLPD